MTERLRRDDEQIPEFQGEHPEDMAHDDPGTRSTSKGARPDHSEREWGGDQDIDTAGQIPSEMATDPDNPESER
jgi:hypothetical protein